MECHTPHKSGEAERPSLLPRKIDRKEAGKKKPIRPRDKLCLLSTLLHRQGEDLGVHHHAVP